MNVRMSRTKFYWTLAGQFWFISYLQNANDQSWDERNFISVVPGSIITLPLKQKHLYVWPSSEWTVTRLTSDCFSWLNHSTTVSHWLRARPNRYCLLLVARRSGPFRQILSDVSFPPNPNRLLGPKSRTGHPGFWNPRTISISSDFTARFHARSGLIG